MSRLIYIASNMPLPKLDAGDGMYHGEVAILPFEKDRILDDIYTRKTYCAYLSWEFSEERAQTILQYIQERLADTDELELWNIWLGGLIEEEKGDYRPKLKSSRTREAEDVDWDDWKLHKVHKKEMRFSQLNEDILKNFFFGELVQKCLIIRK